VKWNHKEADWKQFSMDFTIPAAALASHRLAVRVFDKERVQRKRLLGAVNIRLAGLEPQHPIESWFALEVSTFLHIDTTILILHRSTR